MLNPRSRVSDGGWLRCLVKREKAARAASAVITVCLTIGVIMNPHIYAIICLLLRYYSEKRYAGAAPPLLLSEPVVENQLLLYFLLKA